MGAMSAPKDPHQGGCFYCRWAQWAGKLRCANPGYPVPIYFDQARDDEARCGPRGAWWEPRLELTALEGTALEGTA